MYMLVSLLCSYIVHIVYSIAIGVNVEESKTLDVLGKGMQNVVRWTELVSKDAGEGLGFLKCDKKYFTAAAIRTSYAYEYVHYGEYLQTKRAEVILCRNHAFIRNR